METFFPDESPLRYWLCNASVTHISCSASWPPVIAVTGYAPCVRAWSPTSRDEPEFKSVQQLREVDGERFVVCVVRGDLLVAADASSSGRISIWDTATWTRHQTLTAGAPVTSLDASRNYIAAGTAAGYVRVWKRQSAADPTFTQFFVPDLALDHLPVYTVRLGQLRSAGTGGGGGSGGAGGSGSGGSGGGDGDAVMVVHTRGNGRVSAWRLSDAKIIGTLGRNPGPPGSTLDPAVATEWLLSSNVLHACLSRDNVLLTCSWMPGKDPLLQWIHPVQRAAGEVPGVAQHLAGVAKPLSCDTDGFVIVMGCEDGMVWVWGLMPPASQQQQQQQPRAQPPQPEMSHWRGYHAGAVGAVACLSGPHRGGQIASAGADGCVKLWSPRGALLAVTRLGWQPTALAVNELALVVGGAEGQIQILALISEDQHGSASAASRPTEEDLREARTPPLATASAPGGSGAKAVVPYDYWFDARPPKAAAGARTGPTGASGRVSEHIDAFYAFVPPRRQVTLADLAAVQQSSGSGNGGSGGGGQSANGGAAGTRSGGAGPAGRSGAAAGAAAAHAASGEPVVPPAGGVANGGGHRTSSSSSSSSSFDMRAALKGAHRTAADQASPQAAEEEAKRAQLRAMGEAPGVARSREAVQLESATAALGGRKCANPSCLQREKLLVLVQQQQQQQQGNNGSATTGGFKRCGACKSVFYCSTHCQSTHWRDGHKKECPQLAEAWRQQQQQQQLEAQQRQAQQHESKQPEPGLQRPEQQGGAPAPDGGPSPAAASPERAEPEPGAGSSVVASKNEDTVGHGAKCKIPASAEGAVATPAAADDRSGSSGSGGSVPAWGCAGSAAAAGRAGVPPTRPADPSYAGVGADLQGAAGARQDDDDAIVPGSKDQVRGPEPRHQQHGPGPAGRPAASSDASAHIGPCSAVPRHGEEGRGGKRDSWRPAEPQGVAQRPPVDCLDELD